MKKITFKLSTTEQLIIKMKTLLIPILLLVVGNVVGQTAIPNTTAVTQNFDSMSSTVNLPTNWRMAPSTTSPVWSTAGTVVTQQASTGNPSTGGTYNFGSSASERAVGAMTSSGFASPNNLLGFFQNTNASNLTSLTISYDAERYRINSAAASVQFFYSTNGTAWTAVNAGDIVTTSFPTGTSAYNFTTGTVVNKSAIAITGLNIATNGSFYLRWNINTTGSSSQGIAIDNISVTAGFTAATTPVISSSGTLAAVNTTYGTASVSPTSFNVSGADMSAGILVTPPTGYEVSLTSGSGYANTVTVGASGTIASTPVYVRLSSTATVAGSPYSGNIVLSSASATSVNVATVSSTVTAKALTISVAANNKPYDGTTTAALETPAYVGLVNGETFSVTGTPTATFSDANVGTGKAITISGYTAPNSNYNLTAQPSVTANITTVALSISGVTANNKTYDGTTAATLNTNSSAYDGLVNGDTFSVQGTPSATFASANVANGIAVTISGFTAPSANYTVTQPSSSANITTVALTISGVTADDKTYDQNTTATLSGTPAYSGLVNSESFSVSGAPTATFASANVANGIAVSVTGYTAPNGNYTVTQPSGLTANITAKALTISGLSVINKAEDGTTTAALTGTPALVGVVSGDTVTLEGTYSANFSQNTTGFSIPVTVTGYTISGDAAGNYMLTHPTGLTGDIISVSAPSITSSSSLNATYGSSVSYQITATASVDTFTSTTLPDGLTLDTISGVISGTPTVTGSFNVTISVTNNGGTSSASLAIIVAPKTLTLIEATADVTKVYDGLTTATVSGHSISGAIGSDVVTVSATGAYDTKNVGTGKTVMITYSLNGADASKYSLASTTSTTTAAITAKELTIAGATVSTRPYNGLTNATITGASLSGVVSPDEVNVSGNGTFASADVGSGIAVTSALSINGADASNYTLTPPSLSGTITAAALTITGLTGDNKVYDATTAATISGTPSYNGLVNGETFSVIGTASATFDTASVGNNKTINVTGYNAPSANYTISQPTLSANITSVTLTITGLTATNKVYDGTTTATLAGTATLTGVASGDTVTLGGTPTATFSQSNVGTGLGVTVLGYTLNGASAANYTLSQPTGLTADITAKTLTITANNVSKDPAQVVTGGSGSTAFTSTGLVGTETIGSVTIAYDSTSNSAAGATGNGNTIGTYANQVIPSVATGGTFNASNYAISYVSGNIIVSGFTRGNLVVNRLGVGGTTGLSSTSTAISLLEINPSTNAIVTTISSAFTGSNLLTDSGSGTSNGYLNTNGAYLAVPGYNTALGTASVVSSNTKATNIFGLGYSVAGRTTFPTTVYTGNNFRSVVPVNATTFYTAGTPGGIWYYNGSSFVNVSTTISNTRNVKIFNGNLYFSTGSAPTGIYQVGTSGLPTTTGQTSTLVVATTSPYGFSISPDGNTIYVADDATVNANTGGGIIKWTKSGSTWTRAYTFGTQVRGITVDYSSTNPVIYATTTVTSPIVDNNKIIKIVDTGASATASDVVSAGTNYIFRGIDFAPAAASPTISASGSVAALTTTYGTVSGASSFTVSGAALSSDITVTAPSGIEVSTSATTDFASSITLTNSSGSIASTPVYVRIAATGSYTATTSVNLVLTSTFATTVNVPVSMTVNKKEITITGITGNNKVYDGTTEATLNTTVASYDGLVNGDSFASLAGTPTATFTTKNVGSGKAITVLGFTAPSTNYMVTQPSVTADITTKDVTVTNVTANNKVYDGTNLATLSATLNGVVFGDTVILTADGTFDTTYQTSVYGPQSLVTPSFAISGNDYINYNLISPSLDPLYADITPKPLTITNPTASDKPYDGTTAAIISGTLVGVVSPDNVSLGYVYGNDLDSQGETLSYGVFASPNISSTITVTPYWFINGDTFNYTLTDPNISLTANITSSGASIITSDSSATYTYGDSISYQITASSATGVTNTSFDATNLPAGLSITNSGLITSSANVAVGTYTINLSVTNSSNEVGYKTLTLTVSKKSLTFDSTSFTANDKEYDGTANATLSGTLVGILPGDVVTFNGSGQFALPNVANNVLVSYSNLDSGLQGANATNYSIIDPNSVLSANITKKTLSITASVTSKIYDATTTAIVTVDSISGIVGSEVATITAMGTFADKNVGTGKAVTATYTLGGADAANYQLPLTLPTLTGTITKAPLTYTIIANNKEYDGTTDAVVTISGITGLATGDASTTISLTASNGTFTSANVGTGIVVSNVVVTLAPPASGIDNSGNYSITQPTTLTASIFGALAAGDVAVIGYNTSGNPDTISLLIVKDLTEGTTFYVNDNELATTGSTSFTDLNEGEASFTVKAGQTVTAGTVVVLPWGGAAISTSTYDWSATTGAGLGASDDEVYIYTAPSITSLTPNKFIYYAQIGSSSSSIPSSLTSGVTAIRPTVAASRYSTTCTTYNSCRATLLAEIGKTATNWNTTGATNQVATDWPSFTVQATCPTPVLATTGTLASLTATYGSNSGTTTFAINASALINGSTVTVTAPTGFEVSTNASTGFASSLTFTSCTTTNPTIYVRLASNINVGNYNGAITISSSGATSTIIATNAINTVTPKPLTIIGILIATRVQDGTDIASITGTPVLNGVVSADVSNVIVVTSGATATFAQTTPGTGIAVTILGYALNGSAAGNYSLTQPSGLTGTITDVATPVITSDLALSTVYGDSISYQITATSSNSSYPVTGYSASNLPTGLSVDSNGLISGSSTVAAGTYAITLSATNDGGTSNAILVYTVTKRPLTVTVLSPTKTYDALTTATISVTAFNNTAFTDTVTVTGSGTFDTKNVGTGKTVTTNLVLDTTSATKYTLTQPTIANGEITAKTLFLNGVAAQNKVYDGTTNAIIVATPSGFITGDVVTFSGTGTFASSAIATGIAVTSTATLTGTDADNYTFVQPIGLTANITDTIIYLNTFTGVSACPTNGNIPTMVTDATGTGLTRNTITCNSTSDVFNSTTLNVTSSVNNTSYIEFSASTSGGKKLNITGLYFFRQGSNTAPNQLEVRYSTDNFATSTSWGAAPVTPTVGTGITWDFTDFTTPVNGTVKFRLYPYGTQRANGTSAAASGTFRVDDVTIYGNVVYGPTAASIATTGSTSVCLGTSSAITATITDGTAPYTVVYSDGTSDTTVTNYQSGSAISVTPNATTSYTLVSVTDINSNLLTTNLTGTATVSVNPTPTVATSLSATTYCSGNTASAIALTGTPSGVTFDISGGSAIGLADVTEVTSIPSFPTIEGTATVTITPKANGCSGTAVTYFVDVNGVGQPTLPSTVTICPNTGSTTTLTVASTDITSPVYTWQFKVGSGNWTAITAANAGTGASTVYTNYNSATLGITKTASLPVAATNYRVLISGIVPGCGQTTLPASTTAVLTILTNNTVVLSSAVGTNAQTKCINTAITNITYATTGATGATVSGLPTGVTALWASNVVTISGTPTVSGSYPYTVTLTGGCGTVTATGTLTITPNNTIALTSASGTDAQTKCISTAITSITYATTGATGATVTGLPAGVTGVYTAATKVFAINGAPTVSGSFTYTVSLTAGCGIVTATGTITVTPNMTVSVASNPTLCINTALTDIVRTTTLATGIGSTTTNYGLPAGVSAAWANDVITISGTPTASGAFAYSIPLTGVCASVNATGTITVTPNMTVAAASSTPTLCISTALTAITHTTTLATGIGTPTGLPAGVTAAWAANKITISGTPTASGTFNYSIPLTGGCGTVVATGTITVTPRMTVTTGSSTTLCINTALTAITHVTTLATGIGTATGLPAGVTAAWANDVITISGTPTASGPFNYSIPLTGGCGTVVATGTIIVTPNNTIVLSSAVGTNAQTKCINTAITNITYTTTRATDATVTGLPDGVTALWVSNVLTISGTPTVSGSNTYTVTLTGGCGTVTTTGTIIVTPNNTIALTSASGTDAQTKCISTAITSITYATTGATGATVTGLPAGVTGVYTAATKVFAINGAPTVSGSFTYRVTLTGGCAVITATGTITVTPKAVAGTITSPVSVCYGTNVPLSLTGSVGNTYQWQSTPTPAGTTPNYTGIEWDDVGTGGTSFTDTNVTVPMSYRVIVTSGVCTDHATTVVKAVKIDALPNGGTVSGGSPLCSGGAATVRVTGTIGTYKWQYSVDGGTWTDVPVGTGASATTAVGGYFKSNSASAIASTYLFTNFNLQEASSLSFRVFAKNNTCITEVGSVNPTVFTNGAANAGAISLQTASATSLPICPSASAPALIVTDFIGTLQWQKGTTVTGPWTPITGATASTLTTTQIGALTATTYFRVVASLGTGVTCQANSTPFTMTVAPKAVAGTLTVSGATTVCNAGGINPQTKTFTVTGATGNKFTLQSSPTTAFGSPTTVASNTTGVFTVTSIADTTSYRVIVESTNGSGATCSSATTAVTTITVSKPIAGSISSITAMPICNGTTAALTLGGQSTGTGMVISWQSSLDGSTNWTTVTGATASLTTASLSQNTYYRANVTLSGCVDTTVPYLVSVRASLIAGSISAVKQQLCSPNTGTTLTANVPVGITITGWERTTVTATATGGQTVGTTWTSVATTTTYSTGAITSSFAYRAKLSDGTCSGYTPTFIVTVLVGGTAIGGTTGTQTICPSASRTLTLTLFQGTSYQWQSVVVNSGVAQPAATSPTWTNIPGATSTSYIATGGTTGKTTWYRVLVNYATGACGTGVASTTNTSITWLTGVGCQSARPSEAIATEVSGFEVKAYPNPYAATFNLSLTTSSEDKVGIMVYDMTGRLIERREVRPSEMVEQQIGDRYPSGVYNVVVTQGEEVKTLRVIKR